MRYGDREHTDLRERIALAKDFSPDERDMILGALALALATSPDDGAPGMLRIEIARLVGRFGIADVVIAVGEQCRRHGTEHALTLQGQPVPVVMVHADDGPAIMPGTGPALTLDADARRKVCDALIEACASYTHARQLAGVAPDQVALARWRRALDLVGDG